MRAVVAALAAVVALNVATGGRCQSPRSGSVVVLSKPYNVGGGPPPATYAVDCAGDDKACLEAHGLDPPAGEPTFRPYSQQELEKLLEQRSVRGGDYLLAQFAATVNGKRPSTVANSPANKLADLYMDDEEAVINVLESGSDGERGEQEEQSKSAAAASWHSPGVGGDDRKEGGWVTLEPVPWAHSQIQKWEPHAKPQIPSWESGGGGDHQYRPVDNGHAAERPWPKPRPGSYQYEYKPSSSSHWSARPPAGQDIITDDRPGRFPWPDQQQAYSSSGGPPPQVYEARPRPRPPGEGDGQWVLLSSTKGYSPPPRRHNYQRALRSDADAAAAAVPSSAATLSGHRTVRLTVLPPADNSTTTTRLSHGGLLEVENSGQTVEEAQLEHAAKSKVLRPRPDDDDVRENEVKPSKRKGQGGGQAGARSSGGVQVYAASSNAPDRAAVLTAIGAGMLPATVAMLLPMVLGRRRRRRRRSAGPPADGYGAADLAVLQFI